jgi:hypothetical protein
MKKTVLIAILLVAGTAYATHDSLVKFSYPAKNLQDIGSCEAESLVIDSYSTSKMGLIYAQVKGLANAVNILSSGLDETQKTNINSLSGKMTDAISVEVIEGSESAKSVRIKLNAQSLANSSVAGETSQKQAKETLSLVYYFTIKNALKYFTRVYISLDASKETKTIKAKEVLFSTKYPFTKSSPVLKQLRKSLRKQGVLTSSCF